MRFDLTTLKLLVGAIDHGSIASAAEHEHIVSSAASKRIGELESGLGIALLLRQHTGVVPTAAGEALARHAREVIRTLDRIPDVLSTVSAADDRLDIRILANQTGAVTLAPEVARFMARRPAVRVVLEEGHSLAIIESVAQGSAHLGVIGHFQPTDRLQVIPWRSVPLLLVVPAAHPLADRGGLAFAQALAFDLITLMQGTAIRGWLLAAAARMAREPRFTMQVQSYEAMRAMVRAGLGIGVMPAPNVLPYEDLMQLRALPLTDDWASMQLNVVRDRQTAGMPAIDELLDHLLSRPTA